MPKVVVADASVLILLHKIDELNLLQKLYTEITTTPEVANEFGENLPNWIKTKVASDKKYQKFLETQLDSGEASAIALAAEYKDALLLLDDLKARKLAKKLNLKVTGTLGILHKAKEISVIEKIKPIVEKILLTDFRIADNIVNELLKLNNE